MAHQGQRTSKAAIERVEAELQSTTSTAEGKAEELVDGDTEKLRWWLRPARTEELVDGDTEKLRWWLRPAWRRALEAPKEQPEEDGDRDELEHVEVGELRSRQRHLGAEKLGTAATAQ